MIQNKFKCRKCGKEKVISEFNRQEKNHLGHQVYCKECNRKLTLEWQEKFKREHGVAYFKFLELKKRAEKVA